MTDLSLKPQDLFKLPFTSLYHHVADVDNLRSCYDELNGNKAVGVDGVTKKAYGENLEANLEDLSSRLKRMGYTPKGKRRIYVPKVGSKKERTSLGNQLL